MAAGGLDTSWMWHPHFSEESTDTAGRFVHFRKTVFVPTTEALDHLYINITADTRYKLYINQQLVSFGPVKGDASLWFYDEVDVVPYLREGHNHIGVHVLRFFHATSYAPSFPRLPTGGLRIWPSENGGQDRNQTATDMGSELQSNESWEVSIDTSTKLRIDEPEDDFLHVYEHTLASECRLEWVPVKLLAFQSTTGQAPPWKLSPRLIPRQRSKAATYCSLHNLESKVSEEMWQRALIYHSTNSKPGESASALVLKAGTVHQVDLEVAQHMTAFLQLRLRRPQKNGTIVTLTYAESYEDQPLYIPYLRRKEHRQDYSKQIFGPRDIYELPGGEPAHDTLMYHVEEDTDIILSPFHFRTFRFIRLNIQVGQSDLILKSFDIQQTNYPLDAVAALDAGLEDGAQQLLTTSIRTLENCMHDCYEDCPFYEQLQYAMDTRSSILFTYLVSGDDRLARQAMIQLRNSFQPNVGLTASRAPSHGLQVIPHFSLYWISMICDHWSFFGHKAFVAQFLPIIDAVLGYFDNRLHPDLHLVTSEERPGIWNFHDWTDEWRPYGIPPSTLETGISTYTNNLYAYTLKNAASLLQALGKHAHAQEYIQRAERIVSAIRTSCFNGRLFTDSIVTASETSQACSQHNQAWAVLSGAATGRLARDILSQAMDPKQKHLVKTSISMSFYSLRAMSLCPGDLYNQKFHQFWKPWHDQLALGLTTWEEDSVSQRSDCHAWGSAPIYEFFAEIAGILPAAPGWAALSFKPRLSTYRQFKAAVPLKMVEGHRTGMAHVAWTPGPSNSCVVTLRLELASAQTIPVHIHLPSRQMEIVQSSETMTFTVLAKEMADVSKL